MNPNLDIVVHRIERALVDVMRDLQTLEAWQPELHDDILIKIAPYFQPRNTVTGVPV